MVLVKHNKAVLVKHNKSILVKHNKAVLAKLDKTRLVKHNKAVLAKHDKTILVKHNKACLDNHNKVRSEEPSSQATTMLNKGYSEHKVKSNKVYLEQTTKHRKVYLEHKVKPNLDCSVRNNKASRKAPRCLEAKRNNKGFSGLQVKAHLEDKAYSDLQAKRNGQPPNKTSKVCLAELFRCLEVQRILTSRRSRSCLKQKTRFMRARPTRTT